MLCTQVNNRPELMLKHHNQINMEVSSCLPDFPLCFAFRSPRHGLIRGSSLNYRSRFSAGCVGSQNVPYDSDEHEEYLGESNLSFAYERISTERKKLNSTVTGSNTKVVVSQAPGGAYNQSFYKETTDVSSRNPIVTSQTVPGLNFPIPPIRSASMLETTVTSQRANRSPGHSRASSYDNNNNDKDSNTSPSFMTQKSAPSLSSPMSEGIPDFGTIVETVAAVRNRNSPHNDSTSGISSTCSSQTSTINKSKNNSAKSSSATKETADDWEEIAKVMGSIKGLNKDSVYAQEFEQTFWKIMTGSDLPRYVSTWLEDLGLPQYEKVLCGNGFDNINFLAANILEEQDLIDMNICDASHRRRILDSAKNLPKIRTLHQHPASNVSDWLESIDLANFTDIFMKMGFNTFEKVKKMRDTEIAALIPLRGHRKRIRASVQPTNEKPAVTTTVKTKSTSPPLPRSPLLDKVNFFKDYSQTAPSSKSSKITHGSTSTTETSGVSSGLGYSTGTTGSSASGCSANSTDKNKIETPSKKPKQSKDRRSSRKSHRNSASTDTKLKTFVFEDSDNFIIPTSEPDSITLAISEINKTKQKTVPGQNKENIMASTNSNNKTTIEVPDANRATFLSESGDKLTLRPPNETTVDVSVTSWGHSSESLIKSCCNYQAYYLGSMLVQEVKGVESTVEACAKMKRSTDSMKKIPTITLSISYRGVKFIDSKSKREIAEHEIQNISFASQDAEDLTTFAYITRDARTGNHYCHVFRVTTLNMAYEVILTLGQAFEVAYQLILKEKSTHELPVDT